MLLLWHIVVLLPIPQLIGKRILYNTMTVQIEEVITQDLKQVYDPHVEQP